MEIYLILFFFGCLIGFIGGYAGIGGAPFLVVFLVAILGMSQHQAQGTVLAVMLGPMSLMAVMSMWELVRKNMTNIIIGVLTYAAMSYFGASLAYLMPEEILKALFAILLICIGAQNVISSRRKKNEEIKYTPKVMSPIQMIFVGSVVGIVGGLFGIGAGVLMVPLFISIFRLHKDEARAISLAILLPPVSVGAVIKYHEMDAINWEYAAIIFISYFIVNYFGGKAGAKHDLRKFKFFFGIIMILLGLSYVYLS